jgi:hypothetical protein
VTTCPPKPPTPQAVIAILKRAGFSRSQSSGVYVRTPGYAVRNRPQPGAVEVRWWPDSREVPADADDVLRRRARWLQRYADAILADSRFRCRLSEKDGKVTVYARSQP